MKNLKLKAARVEADLSQAELAASVGVTRQTIGLIEAGDYNPTLGLCVAVCKTPIVCCILMCRKGFVDTGRFGETDTFPTGYFALWSLGAAVLAGLLAALIRALAEYQMVGVQGIFWPVDIAVGIGTAVMVFVLTYLAIARGRTSTMQRRGSSE